MFEKSKAPIPAWALSKSVPDERSELERALECLAGASRMAYGNEPAFFAELVMRLLDEHIERKIAERMKNV